jgi:hypothetical protein
MFVCCKCCVSSGRGLCDGLIPRPEESYRLWCAFVCDLETSKMRRLKSTSGLWKPVKEKYECPGCSLMQCSPVAEHRRFVRSWSLQFHNCQNLKPYSESLLLFQLLNISKSSSFCRLYAICSNNTQTNCPVRGAKWTFTCKIHSL